MCIAADLLSTTREAASRIVFPPVQRLYVPPGSGGPGIESEFGLVVLADGSAGFFFALLGGALARLQRRVHPSAGSTSPLELAAGIESEDGVERAVALGAICAATQHLFRRVGFVPPAAANALGGGDFMATERVGMVGLFPSLARRLRAQGVPLTVLELRADKVERAEGFEVTLDPHRLAGCDTVLCTASTLVNGTLDGVLAHCRDAGRIALIGPSASCFPDPLFRRGIHVVGGSAVTDADALLARLDRGEGWGETVRRYALESARYPGTRALLARSGL